MITHPAGATAGSEGEANAIQYWGTGYGPHIDEEDGRLVYSLLVESSYVTMGFRFDIERADLTVLATDRYRHAALYVVLHTLLQTTFGPNVSRPRRFTQQEFTDVVARVLHSSAESLATYLDEFDHTWRIVTRYYIDGFLADGVRDS
ncbi:hypothetical protein Aph02nite_80750 [Actinoplanes philippinensis]|uniref:Immunity protein 63 n=1 Tax=Actinoplanes philippinensis TaxID=35752 RepID=A0A1I2KTR0_9ACTN|nr:hypothetical protein [Actinoplanes philippinensis]GIE82125.1 hypothetical protein Aph02nite_80750 [Actinoplanes philippinensis]SFF69709.1 hypothetical protein SAMN05421541_11887 [Actinoplanes philippinensis]